MKRRDCPWRFGSVRSASYGSRIPTSSRITSPATIPNLSPKRVMSPIRTRAASEPLTTRTRASSSYQSTTFRRCVGVLSWSRPGLASLALLMSAALIVATALGFGGVRRSHFSRDTQPREQWLALPGGPPVVARVPPEESNGSMNHRFRRGLARALFVAYLPAGTAAFAWFVTSRRRRTRVARTTGLVVPARAPPLRVA
jgi:hypothetical protein